MKLRRCFPPGSQGDMYTSRSSTPLPNNVTAASPETYVSSLTDPSPPCEKNPPPIVPQIRKTTAGTQRARANKKYISHHDKDALKIETTLLDEDMKKIYGMGARKCLIKSNSIGKFIFHFGPSADMSLRETSEYIH